MLDTAAAGGLVIRGAALRVLGYVVGAALAVLSSALLTRHLGVTRFGQYTTVFSVVAVTSVLTELGMSGLATREFATRAGEDRDRFMRDIIGLRIAISLAGVVLAVAFAVAAGYGSTLIAGTCFAAIGVALGSVQTTLAAPLAARLRLGSTSAVDLLRQTVWVMTIVGLILAGAGLFGLLAAVVPAGVVVLVATWWLGRAHTPMRPSFRPTAWSGLLRSTLAFSLATGVGAMYVFATQILTSLSATPTQNGLFAASFRVFIVAASSASLVVSAAFPVLARAARDDHERLDYAVQGLFDTMVILGLAAALAVVTGARPIIDTIAGSHYAGAAGPLRIEGAALIASFLLPPWGLALVSLRRHRDLAVGNLVVLTAIIPITLVLAHAYGATGSAIATGFGEVGLAAIYCVSLSRGDGGLRQHLRIVRKATLAAGPAFAVMLLHLPDVAQLVFALAVYTVGIVLLRAIPRELSQLLPKRLRRTA